jgi:hypothetical protein
MTALPYIYIIKKIVFSKRDVDICPQTFKNRNEISCYSASKAAIIDDLKNQCTKPTF